MSSPFFYSGIFTDGKHKINLNAMKKISRIIIGLCFIIIAFCTVGGVTAYADACSFTLSETVYLGGFPVGITTLEKGLYVDDFATIQTDSGEIAPARNKGINKGDILLSLNGKEVSSVLDVQNALIPNETNRLELVRDDRKYTVNCTPAYDRNARKNLLGLYLSNKINGIGTVTFIRKDGRYSALGHPITDYSGEIAQTYQGKIYACVIDAVTPSKTNAPGRLNGDFYGCDSIGTIHKNTEFGLYGVMQREYGSLSQIKTASRSDVNIGKAKIYTTLKGETPDYYDVEILANSYQPKIKEKGILLKVTDKRLLAIGGIVQGMSGSPIIQDGKLIGALTHVLCDDTTKGYGIYSDFLLQQSNSI